MSTKPLFKQEATKGFLETFAKAQGNIHVSYDHIPEPVATEQGNLILPPPSIENEEQWHGQTHRELSYLTKENKFLWRAQRIYKEGTPHHLAASIIADHIAERRDYGEFAGRSRYLTQNRTRIAKNFEEATTIDPHTLNKETEMLRSLMGYDLQTRKEWMDQGNLSSAKDFENCQYAGNLKKAFGEDGFPLVTNEDEFQELVKRAVHVMEEPPEPEYEEGEGEGGEGEGEGGEGTDSGVNKGEGNDGESGKDGSKGEGQEGEGESEEGEGDSKEGKGEGSEGGESEGQEGEGDGEPITDGEPKGGQHQGQQKDITPEAATGSGADNLKDFTGTGQKSRTDDEIVEMVQSNFKNCKIPINHVARERHKLRESSPYSLYRGPTTERIITGKELDQRANQGGYSYRAPDMRDLCMEASKYPISKKLRKYLQYLQQTGYIYGLKKGKLNPSKVSRVLLGDRQPRMYKEKNASRLNLNTSISLLLDGSGSMSGSKDKVASIIAVCVHDVLKSIQVPYEILGFSDSGRLDHMIYKDFNESIHRETLAGRLTSGNRQMSGNSDPDSVLWACNRLASRPEPNRVLIVLSDGQPAGSFRGDGGKQLRHICNIIETQTPIDLWGIGILTEAPKRFYKQHVVCHDLNKLESVVISILKQSIILKKKRR